MATILIVEDEAALVKNLTLALEDKYTVVTATTGEEGLSKVREEKPDLILLDIMLPDKDGIEILKELKADETVSDIPVIVLTNLSDRETVSRIVAAGGREYLVKADWGINEIVEKIDSVV